MREKTEVAIIGVASPFGADRLGWLALDALQQQGAIQQSFPHLQLHFTYSDRPGARLLEEMCEADAVLIIDAMVSGAPPGSLRLFQAAQLLREPVLLSSHGFGVAEALALAGALDALPEQLLIIGIEMGEEFSGGELPARMMVPLHEAVATALTGLQGVGR